MMPSLPSELYRSIMLSLPDMERNKTLCALSIVSRPIQVEAEALLYHSAKFLYYDFRRMVQFYRAISRTLRRAGAVHFIDLPSAFSGNFSAKDGHKIKKTVRHLLRVTTNLLELRFSAIPIFADLQETNENGQYLEPEIFRGCTFRLRTFHDPMGKFTPENALSFLSQQTEVQDWDFQSDDSYNPVGIGGLPQDIFPLLDTINTFDLHFLSLLAPRPLRRARIWINATHLGSSLRLHSQNLQHLCLSSNKWLLNPIDHPVPTIISFLTSHLPNLKSLSFPNHHPHKNYHFTRLLKALPQFRNLEILIIDPFGAFAVMNAGVNLESERRFVRIPELFMASCPTIRRIALPVRYAMEKWAQGQWISYRRKENGKAELEGYDILNGDSWRTL